ncbi:hypothetical protein JZ751_000470 [Albula glossodonta]|uniref:Syncoilin n=1 Tax=Albula glossodonta TaxID=121402 RepID=A0A8T2PVV6_9TELE|nr:hypothetical protein JZ751_000470 [Albula glossodonta]
MDNGAAQLTPSGALQEVGVQFEEVDFFEDCMEEFRVQFEECMDRLGAQFKGCLDETGDEFEDCVEDVVTQSTGSVTELAVQIEECMAELGIQLQGSAEGSRPQFGSLMGLPGTQARGSMEGILALPQSMELTGPHLEAYIEDVGSRLKGCVETVRQHCQEGVRELGAQFAGCIEEVTRLEQRRDQLVQELLQLEAPMAQAVEVLRAELGELRKCLTQVELERQSLQEERLLVKRQLFAAARDCTQSRVALATQQHDVEQFSILQGELEGQAQLLTEEVAQLRQAQQNQLNALRSRLDSLGTARGQEDHPQTRQPSWDLRNYLQDGIKALEEQYEPRLQALERRRQAAADALVETRAHALDLRARLGPLREEAHKLALQRACLEERITLMQREREHSDTVDTLEESTRKLKTELQIQRKKNEEIQTLRDSLTKELDLYRGCPKLHGKLISATEGT